MENLVEDLLQQQDNDTTKIPSTLDEAMEYWQLQLKEEYSKTIRVDPQDVLTEALAHYKDPNFDPSVPLKIRYKGQPAVDTGGVIRQFYTDSFCQMLEGVDGMPPLFEGAEGRKLPIYNTCVAVSGVMKLVGKLFAHCLVQTGTGPSFLAPVVYKYLCTGDFQSILGDINIEDASTKSKHFINDVIFLLFKL